MILDTTFLIDLQREFRRQVEGSTRQFLSAHATTRFQISVISATEFLEGFDHPPDGERLIRNFPWIPVDAEIAKKVATYRRTLRQSGQLIGDFDLLIGGTAAVLGLPLVTANADHFKRLDGLEVITY